MILFNAVKPLRPALEANKAWLAAPLIAVVSGFGYSPVAAPAGGNPVADWNAVFLDAVQIETTPPPLVARNLAILHVAMFDAANAVTRTHHAYQFTAQDATNTEPTAAAIGAGHQVSVALFPSRKAAFDALLARHLAGIEDSPAKTNGLDLGRQCGDSIIALRADDGSTTMVPYLPSDKPGRWRRTPPYFRPPELPQWRLVKPFALTNIATFRPPSPPALDSERWAHELEETRQLGGNESKTRTPEQAEITRFWSDFSYTTTPPGHWNEVARNLADAKKLSLEDSARLFALLNLAMADAAIVCWDAKYEYDFWRPVTASHEAERDGNSATASDPGWQPLLPTPSHPEYPSGHSTFSGAAAAVLANFFGTDEIEFTVASGSLPGVQRKFTSFSQAAEEVGRSRIYGGIHFPSADEGGRKAGERIGNQVAKTVLSPSEK